ncbi:MAG TPA: hypothetical protein PLM63_01495 [bacterium]|nr:hypothetical protein [bacterium]
MLKIINQLKITMELNNLDQIFRIINENSKILILTDSIFNFDKIAASLSFGLFTQILGKNTIIYFKNTIEEKYKFLNGFELIKNNIDIENNLTIAISTKDIKAKELSYEQKEDRIEIYLTPEKNKKFTKEDVSIIDNQNLFDLIITIGVENIEKIGEFYNSNIEFFKDTPIINIDNNIANERFGQINLIEPQYSSICELMFDLITMYKSELIDEKIATNILAGIIYKNKKLNLQKLSSNTVEAISALIEIGADKEKIINNLYKTRNLNDLRVWSKILQNSKLAYNNTLFFSIIDDENEQIDFSDFFNNIIDSIGCIKIGILFNKINDIIYITLITRDNINAKELLKEFNPIGDNEEVNCAVSSSDMNKAVEIVLNKIIKKIQ